jgi:hypothetical protein
MNRVFIVIVLVMIVFAAVVVVVNSVNAVSAQNITCDLACQEAIINEADSDDIVDRMMKECGLLQPNMNATNVECTDRILAENATGNE